LLHDGRDTKLYKVTGAQTHHHTGYQPAKQWHGGESFVKTSKKDYANLDDRPNSKTVMAQLQAWFDGYNSYHLHSTLDYIPPKLFREKL
jgi:transposase InsO family protein